MTAKYPTAKVILCYCLFGGIVGGLIYSLLLGGYLLIDQLLHHSFKTDLTAVMDVFYGFLGLLMGSFIVGFIPALFASLAITTKEIRLLNKSAYFQTALSGFLATLPISGFFVFAMLSWSNGSIDFNLKFLVENILTIFAICGVGALSSVIVGYFVLPKAKN